MSTPQINTNRIYQFTINCFDKLIYNLKSEQTGGGDYQSIDLNLLYKNMTDYAHTHNIRKYQKKTILPYGIILSALNLPNDPHILNLIYPALSDYDYSSFDSKLPLGIFLDDQDIFKINQKLNF